MAGLFRLLPVLVLVFGLAQDGRAQTLEAERAAIQSVIGSQMDAFKVDDGELAFSYAAPSIQKIFRNSDNFMTMVRQGYAPVYRPVEIDYRDIAVVNGKLVQRVFIRGADGEAVIATYTMEKTADGSWKISGCEIEKLPEVSA